MDRSSPLSAPLLENEFAALLRPVAPGEGQKIAVAVSGGADSLSLTLMLGQWCRAHDISLTALTVDHGLRKDAAKEARQVADWLIPYDIPHVTLRWQGDKPESNIQDQARLARYRLMGQWCTQNKVTRLFLAHHQGDQAETFLIRLFRGSGVDGLSAMKETSAFPVPLIGGCDVTICRPLLSTPKARLEATLQHMRQPWIEDPSNRNDSYTRVKVRNLLGENDIEGLNAGRMAQTAARMGRVKSLLNSLEAEVIHNAVTFFPEGYAEVRLESLLSAHEEIALRCLAGLVRAVSGGVYGPRLARLEALYGRLRGQTFSGQTFSGQTLGGCLLTPLQNGRLMISREIAAIGDAIPLEANSIILWDGRFIIENVRAAGTLKRLELADWQAARQKHPELKALKLAKVVRESLPCVIDGKGNVILPNLIPVAQEPGFTATFRSRFSNDLQ